jgi:hypothetical protein
MTPARIDGAGSASTKTGSLYLQVFARIGRRSQRDPGGISPRAGAKESRDVRVTK